MKRLKFVEDLVPLVLSGEKDTTWRIDDDKDLSCGDILSLIRVSGEEFTRAEILWVKETKFAYLSDEDKQGHEKFGSMQELYDSYLKYYKKEVGPEYKVKVVKFKLNIEEEIRKVLVTLHVEGMNTKTV
jgi:hypothetical protein